MSITRSCCHRGQSAASLRGYDAVVNGAANVRLALRRYVPCSMCTTCTRTMGRMRLMSSDVKCSIPSMRTPSEYESARGP